MILSFLLLLVSLASHLQNTSCKSIFEHFLGLCAVRHCHLSRLVGRRLECGSS